MMKVNTKKFLVILSTVMLLGCGTATSSGQPETVENNGSTSEVTQAPQTEAESENTASETDEFDAEAFINQFKEVSGYLQEATSHSEDGSEFLNKVSNESNIGDMAYDCAQASVRYGLMVNKLQDAINASEGIEELESFRQEMNKTIEMFPDAVDIKDKDDVVKYMENCRSFIDQYRKGMEEWMTFLEALTEM